jgi:hypothetical protein
MKTREYFTVMAIAIITLAVLGCKQDASPQSTATPVPQSKTLEGVKNAGNVAVNITVYYTALPGVVPSYMSPLEVAVKTAIEGEAKTGPLTINVINGDSPFAIIDGVLTVGTSWLSNKNAAGIFSGMSGSVGSWNK